MSEVEFAPHVLREYAVLADGERAALVGPGGDIVWLCAPHWDSDAVFSALIGGIGEYAISPVGRFVWGGFYEHGLIWRSRWVTDTGIIECREALAFPGHTDRLVLLRQIHAVRGDAELQVTLRPAAGFGAHPMTRRHRDDHGIWHARCARLMLRWQGAGEAHLDHTSPTGPDGASEDSGSGAPALRTRLHIPAGHQRDLVLELAEDTCGLADQPPSPQQLWQSTETHWREQLPPLADNLAPRDAAHSYAVLRGLTSHSGGMVAAATMSLPERANQGRNYDYRYVWIRDQCYAGQAVAADGAHPLLDDAVRFVTQRLLEDGPNLKPAYTIRGGPVPDERPLRLPGYPGGTDIAGNHVNAQFQLDAFGEALLLLAAAARHDHLNTDNYQAIHTAVAAITERWKQPDAGIWELEPRRWAHSRLICVAGLRAVAAGAAARGDIAGWTALADALLADASSDCLHPSGRWQRAPEDARIDAALLLAQIRGALPAHDPRSAATLAAVAAELSDDQYVYRFRHDQRPLAHAEGAFTLCGFLMALATHQRGDTHSALRYFERNRAACGPPGLLSEEYDVVQRQMRGNLPQAFSHALLLESASHLAGPPADERAR
jgi:GH15 family glucan-1,4-alpha-glucosidase